MRRAVKNVICSINNNEEFFKTLTVIDVADVLLTITIDAGDNFGYFLNI